jgi:uncharacterized membrane protein YdjX (TVP38/TMEM64 family)
MVVVVVVAIALIIGTGLFLVKTYFLPELERQRHHLNVAAGHTAGGSQGSSSAENGGPATGHHPLPSDPTERESDAVQKLNEKAFLIIIGAAGMLASLPIPTLYTVTCIGAGFALNDFPKAFAVLLPSILLGIALMFAASRRWLHNLMSGMIRRRYPALHRLVHASQGKGLIVMLRLTPVPFSLQTMLWGSCSTIDFSVFFPWTLIVVVPQVALLAYFGSQTTNLSQTLNTRNPIEMILLALGVIVSVVGYWRLSAWAKREVQRSEEEQAREAHYV